MCVKMHRSLLPNLSLISVGRRGGRGRRKITFCGPTKDRRSVFAILRNEGILVGDGRPIKRCGGLHDCG